MLWTINKLILKVTLKCGLSAQLITCLAISTTGYPVAKLRRRSISELKQLYSELFWQEEKDLC